MYSPPNGSSSSSSASNPAFSYLRDDILALRPSPPTTTGISGQPYKNRSIVKASKPRKFPGWNATENHKQLESKLLGTSDLASLVTSVETSSSNTSKKPAFPHHINQVKNYPFGAKSARPLFQKPDRAPSEDGNGKPGQKGWVNLQQLLKDMAYLRTAMEGLRKDEAQRNATDGARYRQQVEEMEKNQLKLEKMIRQRDRTENERWLEISGSITQIQQVVLRSEERAKSSDELREALKSMKMESEAYEEEERKRTAELEILREEIAEIKRKREQKRKEKEERRRIKEKEKRHQLKSKEERKRQEREKTSKDDALQKQMSEKERQMEFMLQKVQQTMMQMNVGGGYFHAPRGRPMEPWYPENRYERRYEEPHRDQFMGRENNRKGEVPNQDRYRDGGDGSRNGHPDIRRPGSPTSSEGRRSHASEELRSNDAVSDAQQSSTNINGSGRNSNRDTSSWRMDDYERDSRLRSAENDCRPDTRDRNEGNQGVSQPQKPMINWDES